MCECHITCSTSVNKRLRSSRRSASSSTDLNGFSRIANCTGYKEMTRKETVSSSTSQRRHSTCDNEEQLPSAPSSSRLRTSYIVRDLCCVDPRTCYSRIRACHCPSEQMSYEGDKCRPCFINSTSCDDCFESSDNYELRHRRRRRRSGTLYPTFQSSLCRTSSLCRSGSWLFSLPSWVYLFLILISTLRIAESCSSRSTPKPKPPSATMRPNVTFVTYACPPDYATWFCLNGATCFTVTIGESILYNCECADGYMGQRCEFKDLDQSYLPSRDQVMVETASIAGSVTVAVLLIVIVSISISVYCRRRSKIKPVMTSGIKPEDLQLKPFRTRASFSSSIRMSTTMYSSPKEPESGHKVMSNSKAEQPTSTSA